MEASPLLLAAQYMARQRAIAESVLGPLPDVLPWTHQRMTYGSNVVHVTHRDSDGTVTRWTEGNDDPPSRTGWIAVWNQIVARHSPG